MRSEEWWMKLLRLRYRVFSDGCGAAREFVHSLLCFLFLLFIHIKPPITAFRAG